MSMRKSRARFRRGQTLVATLIVLVIIAMLAVVMMNGSLGGGVSHRADGHGTTIPGAVQYAARDDVCRSNLGQVRAAIEIAKTNDDDKPPASLDELRIGKSFEACPIKPNEPYDYDPQTGIVKCVHPGHEKY